MELCKLEYFVTLYLVQLYNESLHYMYPPPSTPSLSLYDRAAVFAPVVNPRLFDNLVSRSGLSLSD